MAWEASDARVQDFPRRLGSEAPPSRPAGAMEAEWRSFRERLHEAPGFRELAGEGTGLDVGRLERACRMSWELSTADNDGVAQRLEDLNLNSLKQQDVLREKKRRGDVESLTEERMVDFYEPLRYVSSNTRQLVIAILADKVDQLLQGGGNRWLLKELAEAGAGGGGQLKAAFDAAEERAEKAEGRAKLLERQLAEARDDAREMRADLKVKERDIKAGLARELKLQEQVTELAEELAGAKVQIRELEAGLAQMEEELASSRDVQARLENELATAKAELERVSAELEKAVQELELLRARCGELEERLNVVEARLKEAEEKIGELQGRVEELERRTAAAEARAAVAEAEAAELRERLRQLLENRRSAGTQTDLKGPQLEQQKEENTRLKGMLEEMRLKLTSFCKELAKRFPGKDIQDLLERSGLAGLVQSRSCFERLYDDAMERIVRLEKLQEDYAEQRKPDLPAKFAVREDLVGAIERSTLEKDTRAFEQRAQEMRLLDRKLVQPPTSTPLLGISLPPLQLSTPRTPALPWGSSFMAWHRTAEPRRRSPDVGDSRFITLATQRELPRRAAAPEGPLPLVSARRVAAAA